MLSQWKVGRIELHHLVGRIWPTFWYTNGLNLVVSRDFIINSSFLRDIKHIVRGSFSSHLSFEFHSCCYPGPVDPARQLRLCPFPTVTSCLSITPMAEWRVTLHLPLLLPAHSLLRWKLFPHTAKLISSVNFNELRTEATRNLKLLWFPKTY